MKQYSHTPFSHEGIYVPICNTAYRTDSMLQAFGYMILMFICQKENSYIDHYVEKIEAETLSVVYHLPIQFRNGCLRFLLCGETNKAISSRSSCWVFKNYSGREGFKLFKELFQVDRPGFPSKIRYIDLVAWLTCNCTWWGRRWWFPETLCIFYPDYPSRQLLEV